MAPSGSPIPLQFSSTVLTIDRFEWIMCGATLALILLHHGSRNSKCLARS